MNTFSAVVERFSGVGGWYYVAVPAACLPLAKTPSGIKGRYGFIPAEFQVGGTRFKSSLMPKGDGTYFVALKATVRSQEGIAVDDTINVRFWYS